MQKYTCKKCEAELFWDSESQQLKCEYCGQLYDPEEFNDTNEQAGCVVKNENTTDDSQGFALLKYICDGCGAEVITAAGTLATTCVHCGRALSMNKKLEGIFKPDYVIPFAIAKPKAIELYKQYIKGFCIPKEFSEEAQVEKIKGLYVPFWLHSFRDDSTAEFQCEKEIVSRRNDDKVVTHQKYQVNMAATTLFDKLPTDALTKMDDKIMDALEPFNYQRIEEFHPGYMAGYYAEEYNEDVVETFPRARKRAVEAIKVLMKDSINKKYDTIYMTKFNDAIITHSADYAMLPIWLLTVTYQNKQYIFAVNGVTGKVAGRVPLDVKKLTLCGICVTLVTTLLVLLMKFLPDLF